MAKFCRFCGKQINDGVCDCPQSVAAAEAAGVVGRQVSTMFVNIIASPVNVMRQAIADGNKLPQYLMAVAYAMLIQLVLTIVLVFVGRTMVVNFISDALGTAMNSLNSLSSWY